MNIFSIKKRFLIAQSLFFAAHLFVASSLFASEKSTIDSSFNRIQLNKEYEYLNPDGSLRDPLIQSGKFPSIQILEEQPENKRYGICHNYAISKQLGLKGQIPETLPIVGAEDWHTALNFTKEYCEEVSTPQPGDLVTYYPHNRSLTPTELIGDNGIIDFVTHAPHNDAYDITHTGIVHDNGLVESKWGRYAHVLLHPTFHVPTHYGNHVKYHRINKPTHEIVEDIKRRIPNYTYKTVCAELNNQLVKYAEQSDNFKMGDLWQRQMCLDVEASNDQGQSLLMIGAKNNNLPLVKIALTHKADLNKKDNNGKTAIYLAKENGHSSMVALLKQHKPVQQKSFLYRTFKQIATPSNAAQNSFWETTRS
jgi:hypothetical protein